MQGYSYLMPYPRLRRRCGGLVKREPSALKKRTALSFTSSSISSTTTGQRGGQDTFRTILLHIPIRIQKLQRCEPRRLQLRLDLLLITNDQYHALIFF